MKKFATLLLVCLILFFSIGCTKKEPIIDEPNDVPIVEEDDITPTPVEPEVTYEFTQVFEDSNSGISFSYPSDWEEYNDIDNEYLITMFMIDSYYGTNLIVASENACGLGLKSYTALSNSNLKESMDINNLSTTYDTIGDYDVVINEYETTSDNGIEFRQQQFMFIENDTVYLFSLTASDIDYEENSNIVRDIISTVDFK